MIAHPDTQLAVIELRRNELMRTARQERLAAIACEEPMGSRHAEAWGLARDIAAILPLAAQMRAASHRSQQVLLPLPR